MRETTFFAKRFVIIFFSIVVCGLCSVGTLIFVVDPWLHYRTPRSWFSYQIGSYDDTYEALGIVTNLNYNALIIGTSQSINLKCYETSELFEEKDVVRASITGASYKEIELVLDKAFKCHPDIDVVIRPLDAPGLLEDKDYLEHPESKGLSYLYNEEIVDDISYLWNLNALIRLADLSSYSIKGINRGDKYLFDDFPIKTEGFTWTRLSDIQEMKQFNEEDRKTVEATIQQNVLKNIEEHPDTEFYYFFTPYSIAQCDSWFRAGELNRILRAQLCAIELMTGYDNLHLFSFWNVPNLAENYDFYANMSHYNKEVGSQILYWMAKGEYEITELNKDAYSSWLLGYYLKFGGNCLKIYGKFNE